MDASITDDFRRFDEWRFGERPGYARFDEVWPTRAFVGQTRGASDKETKYERLYDTLLRQVSHSSPETRKGLAQTWRSTADPAHDDGIEASTKSDAAPKHSNRQNDAHFRLLNEWLEQCDTTHHHRREEPYPRTGKPRLPKRLLYVGPEMPAYAYTLPRAAYDSPFLVSTRHQSHFKFLGPYIAVSHRWGDFDKKFQTTTANIEERMKSISLYELEKTFQDAIIVARRLGFHCIWVDSLCIVQDDEDELQDEMKSMEDIFSLASCTIAATSAKNSGKGLLCRSGMPSGNNFDDEVEKSELSTRGWVLQERALSRRTIHFGVTQTYWECGAGIACESDPKCQPRSDIDTLSSSLSSSFFPEFGSFSRKYDLKLIQDIFAKYSRLELSVKTDNPWAVAGLEYRLATYCGTLTVYGVFAKFFYKTLLWQRGADNLQHIDFSKKPIDEPPSWSWMAYTGGIDYLPVPDVGLTSKTYVKFSYPNIGTRCALVGPLWKVPIVTLLEQHKNDDAYWIRYDNDRGSDGENVNVLEFMPILDLSPAITCGLLIKANDQGYRRIGVASVKTGSGYAASDLVTVN